MNSTTSKGAPMKHLREQPEYLATTAEHNELAAAAAKVETRIREIELLLASDPDLPTDRDAAQVRNALHFGATGEVRGLSNDPTMLREEHVLLRQQRDALTKAMVAKFNAIDEIARGKSNEITTEHTARHRAIAARYVALMEQADAVVEEEIALRKAIHSKGYEACFTNLVHVPGVDRSSDRQSVLGRHCAALKAYSQRD